MLREREGGEAQPRLLTHCKFPGVHLCISMGAASVCVCVCVCVYICVYMHTGQRLMPLFSFIVPYLTV